MLLIHNMRLKVLDLNIKLRDMLTLSPAIYMKSGKNEKYFLSVFKTFAILESITRSGSFG